MLYWLLFTLFVVSSMVMLKLIKIRYTFSISTALGLMLSIVSMICLSQNYTYSLIADINDGISISNFIAYLHIGEDGWTIERFKLHFEISIYVSLLIILLLLISLIFETKKNLKIKNSR